MSIITGKKNKGERLLMMGNEAIARGRAGGRRQGGRGLSRHAFIGNPTGPGGCGRKDGPLRGMVHQ